MKLVQACVAATMLGAVTAHAAPPALTAAAIAPRVDEFVRSEMRREQVPGLALGIFQQGQVVIAKGYGYSNLELAVPVSSATVFQTASVGKQFTAVAVMLQVEDGKLKLDEPITRYFPDAPASWRAITVRHLLTHTSGISDYLDASGGSATELFDERRDYTEDELLRIYYRLALEFEPGAKFSYSNTGYALLGFIVHRVSGQFYGDVLRDRVFKPLGMKTARVISEADIVPDRAAGYQLVDGVVKNQDWIAPSINTTADGALYLSLADYAAWDRGLRAKAILTPDSWAEIYSPVRLRSGKTYPYGFGWEVDESRGKPWYHHSGSWQGFTTYISRYLADDLTLVVLTNCADASTARFIDGVAAIIDPALAQVQPSRPIPDRDPAVAERVRRLLGEIAAGRLPADEWSHGDRSQMEQIKGYTSLLGPLGPLERLELLDRRAMGDELSSTYAAHYAAQKMRVDVSLAPDGRWCELEIQAE